MSYRRGNAVLYAAAYWDKVCDDGYVALGHGTPAYVKRIPGEPYPADVSGDDDCTHFVSRCLGPHGGGLQIEDPQGPSGLAKGILSAPRLVYFLSSSHLAVKVLEKASRDEAVSKLSLIKPGDVIAYWWFPRPGQPGRPDYGHTVLHLGDGLIAAHSISRYGVHFNEAGGAANTITFLHFKEPWP